MPESGLRLFSVKTVRNRAVDPRTGRSHASARVMSAAAAMLSTAAMVGLSRP